MIRRIKNELKIAGINFFLTAAALTAALTAFSFIAGELLDLSCFGFEVIFPFFTAIAVGEWGRTKTDDNFDAIAAQSRSLIKWAALRYLAIFGASSLSAIVSMIIVTRIRCEMPLWELFLIYFPPAFFLSSLSELIGIKCPQEHMAALVCGTLWLALLLARCLLQIPGMEYFYLFIRYAGDPDGIWMPNKCIVGAGGLVLWFIIYWKYRK